jgi:DNA-binding winged-HTH domains
VQYIINSSIVFDRGDGTLKHPESNDVVQLPLPAQRLLLIILESGGEILSRDFLFREVWDKFGLTGSNSNLNQYLSLLRRNMMVFGCENFVITLPKVGIRLDEHISIVKEPKEKLSDHPFVPEPAEPQDKKNQTHSFLN